MSKLHKRNENILISFFYNIKNNQKFMVKLYKLGAEWCSPCKEMDKRLANFTACELEKVDVDDEGSDDQALAEHVAELIDRFKVKNIPVLVLVNEKEEVIKKWIGLTDIKDIENEITKVKQL